MQKLQVNGYQDAWLWKMRMDRRETWPLDLSQVVLLWSNFLINQEGHYTREERHTLLIVFLTHVAPFVNVDQILDRIYPILVNRAVDILITPNSLESMYLHQVLQHSNKFIQDCKSTRYRAHQFQSIFALSHKTIDREESQEKVSPAIFNRLIAMRIWKLELCDPNWLKPRLVTHIVEILEFFFKLRYFLPFLPCDITNVIYGYDPISWSVLLGGEPMNFDFASIKELQYACSAYRTYCREHKFDFETEFRTFPVPESLRAAEQESKKLMQDCWQQDPSKRPSLTDIISRLDSMKPVTFQELPLVYETFCALWKCNCSM